MHDCPADRAPSCKLFQAVPRLFCHVRRELRCRGPALRVLRQRDRIEMAERCVLLIRASVLRRRAGPVSQWLYLRFESLPRMLALTGVGAASTERR